MLGHMGYLPPRDLGRDYLSNVRVDVGEVDEEDYDHIGSHISALAETMEITEEKVNDPAIFHPFFVI